MGQIQILAFVTLLAVAGAVLMYQRWMLDALIEAINRFRGGGPPRPMHPSPVGDAALLRRRAKPAGKYHC